MQLPFFLQVSYLANASCTRSNDPFLIAVSCPPELIDSCRNVLCKLFCYCYLTFHIVSLLLVQAGDVGLNPGPASGSASSLESISKALSRLELSQSTMLNELSLIRSSQTYIEASLSTRSARVEILEKRVDEVQSLHSQPSSGARDCVANFASQLKVLAGKCDDAENRQRRSNLLFLGIPDANNKSWAQSELRVPSFLSEKLDISIAATDLERAHRLGRFHENKNRPIIVKFAPFKDKTAILQAASKLKGSSFAVREDYSARVRTDCKKLHTFGVQTGSQFKIRFDKLLIADKQFVYDADSDSVIQLTK